MVQVDLAAERQLQVRYSRMEELTGHSGNAAKTAPRMKDDY